MADRSRPFPDRPARGFAPLALTGILLSTGTAIAAPADVDPIAGFDKGTFVAVNGPPVDGVLFEMVMPEDGNGEGYGRVRKDNCDAEQPHAEILCDYAGVLGLATFATDEDGTIGISLDYDEADWSVAIDLKPRPDEPNVYAGDAAFTRADAPEDPVATVPVTSVIGMFTITLTLDRFQDAR